MLFNRKWGVPGGSLVLALLLVAYAHADSALHVPAMFPTIQAAIDAAPERGTVVVAAGTYTGPGNTDLDFRGKALTVRSAGGPFGCYLDCGGTGRAFLFHSGETAASVVDGFGIRNGNAGPSLGAAVYVEDSSPTIINCVFSQNSGGGIAVLRGRPTIAGCSFNRNTPLSGGGIYMSQSRGSVTNCLFHGNQVQSYGGGMYLYYSSPTIAQCVFVENSAGEGIGALGMIGASSAPVVSECIFSGNVAREGSAGALQVDGCRATITHCDFRNNRCLMSGEQLELIRTPAGCVVDRCTFTGSHSDSFSDNVGGILIVIGEPMVQNCTFTGNRGGIRSLSARPILKNCAFTGCTRAALTLAGGGTVTNCVFTGNVDPDTGGAIRVYSGPVTLNHCTLVGNSSAAGAVYYGEAAVTARNCILWANSEPQILNAPGLQGSFTADHSNIQGGLPGAGNLDVDPLFVRNPSDGGDGWADRPATPINEAVNNDYGDLRLHPGSPCIDRGAIRAPALPSTDLDHNPRVVGAASDMGAYEYGSSSGARLTLLLPAAGEFQRMTTNRAITWASRDVTGEVKLEYSVDDGTNWTPIYDSTANDGAAVWTVQGPRSDRARIRISSIQNPDCFDVRDFTIARAELFWITYPNGGEPHVAGTRDAILWETGGVDELVTLEYSIDGGNRWHRINGATENDGYAVWTVQGPATNRARIRITSGYDSTTFDASDGDFSIAASSPVRIICPNGGETHVAGTDDAIIWNSTGVSGNVKIEYSTDGGVTWLPVYHNTENDGYALWTVQGPPTSRGRIRITSLTDPSHPAVSEGNFTINPATPPGGTAGATGSPAEPGSGRD
jgi:parallel beta-helix repeat protein